MAGAGPRIATATVLFTDVVGSTALRVRIGEEAADALRMIHDDLLGAEIAAHRGAVVKHTGDGLMATFTAAADAVAAAVAIQQAVDRHNRRGERERLDVRIGLSVGDVSFEDDDCFGLPVVEAQRLEAAAEGGKILCSETIRHLARGRGNHEFDSVGDLSLKGIGVVRAAEVRWEPIVPAALPRDISLPSLFSQPRGFDLAGRSEELAALVDAWKDSAEGRRRVVLVSGAPGVGKTRLAMELALVARDQGALVLAGRCDEELDLPFQPFVEALRAQVELGDHARDEWLGPFAGDLAWLVPELRERVAGLSVPARGDPESDRLRLHEAVTGWLHATTASIPVLLVLDDLQWADRPTVQLLRHLVHETPRDALCIVATYRSTELDQAHPLTAFAADLQREAAATRLALDPLNADGVAEFLELAAGHDLDDAGIGLARALFAETLGNPFFVGEIVRHLVENGTLIRRDDRWTSDLALDQIGMPEGVREVVNRRIMRLGEDVHRLLSIAAVIGHEFALPVLAAVADVDEDRAFESLDRARSSSLVDEIGVDRYRFAHALVRATLLEELTPTRRVRTHRKIADTIERVDADHLDHVVDELAYHYGEAAASVPEKALQYATLAGDRAYAAPAADEAARWYELALVHADAAGAGVAVRVDLLTRLGRAEVGAGIREASSHLREAALLAQGAGLYAAMADALTVTLRASYHAGAASDPEKIELLEHLLERLDDDVLRARTMCALAIELIFVGGDVARRVSLVDDALEVATQSGDPAVFAQVAAAAFMAIPPSRISFAWLEEARPRWNRALAAAEALEDSWWRTALLSWNGVMALVAGDGAAYRTLTAVMADHALRCRTFFAEQTRILHHQILAGVEGRLVEAEALATEHFELLRPFNLQEAIGMTGVMQVSVRREQGRVGEIIPAWATFPGAADTAGPVAATLAFAYAETGDLDEAASRVRAGAGHGFADAAQDATWWYVIAMWTEAAVMVRDREAAARLHELQIPYDGGISGTGGVCSGPFARLFALVEDLLDRHDDADRHFAEAIEQSQRLMSPVWTARCQLDWAERLATRGRLEHARRLVDQADEAIATLTLPRLQQQSAELRNKVT